MDWREGAKKRAAIEAVKHVRDGFFIGLGSGDTAAYAIQEVGRRIKREGLRVAGVPTSYQAMLLAVDCGIPITTLDEHPELNLTIDGADQIDKELNLIKGMGGALTRERIVACASRQLIIVADETKLVERLGTNHPVPVEVLPFALSTVMSGVLKMGGNPHLRRGRGKVGPVITDNGNLILDVEFGPINDPRELHMRLKSIPGVIETGLFIEMAHLIYVGKPTTVQRLERT
ncbi:MAG: Ribose-5-phosphate isomerase A [Candidatus Bathyarchaeota archaeon BA1]|nr:MAG: Ribose-5-phosphate isomerase A [Candidatus Bathyarchaeota archaeon BA1]